MIEILMHGTEQLRWKATRTVIPFVLGACMAALSGCSTFVNSGSDRDFNNRVYVGAGALVSQLEPDTSDVAGTSVDDSMDSGGSLALGYDVNHRISVEGHLASLGEATVNPAGTIGYTVGGISGLYYGLNDARDRARRQGFAVFGRLGLGAMDNDASGVKFKRVNDVHLLAGVGLEYGMSRGLGLRAEFVAHETDAKYAQLGLVYRFGLQQSKAWQTVPMPGKPSLVDDVPIVGPIADELPAIPVTDQEALVKPPAKKPASVSQQDADGDKVFNEKDQCPDTMAGLPVKVDGCPIFGGVVDGINFRQGSDTLTATAVGVLAGIAETLREYPDIRIIIEAHTDNRGEASDNLQLSKRRAIAVAQYLVDAGISGSRLRAQAYGESRPRTTNQSAQGRAANRRVEFSIQ